MDDLLKHMDVSDVVAFGFFICCWIGYAWFAAHSSHREDLLTVTNRYRLQWMRKMLGRDNRSVDAIIIGNLMRSITFSANTTIFILAGLLGILGYHQQIGDVISAIPFAKPMTPVMWELKISLLIVIFVYAYFKYTWSLRQHTYTSILVGAAPSHEHITPVDDEHAVRGAYLAGNAAKHFNNGLRAYYFGLAALGWFVHPYLFMIATALVVFVTHRREYHSQTLKHLM